MEGLTAQCMSEYVALSCSDAGAMDEEKMVKFFDLIAKRTDLTVGYLMGLDQVLELMHDSFKTEVLSLEDTIGGTKTTPTILEGAIGTRSTTLEGYHPTIWGSVAKLSATTQ